MSVVAEAELRAHLPGVDTTLLLVCAVHVTGDRSLLDRFADKVGLPRGYILGPVEAPVEPATLQAHAELTDILCAALTKRDQSPYLGATDLELVSRMADLAVGTHFDPKLLPMYLEQSGFLPDQRAIPPSTTPPATLNLAIIGAGMTGLDAAVKATDRGFDYEVFEMEADIGGLWWSQTYPGVAVDTPSVYYSLSYEMTPDWSRHYPIGEEYQSYLTGLAKKYELTDRLHFNSKVSRMEWLDAEQVWELTIQDTVENTARTVRAGAVITGAGLLCRPKYPNVPGRETFAGTSVHTVRWRDIDLAGKRGAVIGVGAAGIQVIASLADQFEHLTVFQRQAHWVMPNLLEDNGVVADGERWLRRHLPYYQHWSRFLTFWQMNVISYDMCKVDEDWTKTHSLSVSAENDMVMQIALASINGTFGEGSELARKLTPDFAFGAKRPIRDPGSFEPGGYYYALAQPHVDLVTSGLARVVPEGIVTADGTLHELDVIIWATGMTLDWLSPIDIIGRNGVTLNQVWADNNPRSYLGGTVPGFPNLFVNDGPNTGVATGGAGHNFMAETVDHYAFECLQLMVERGATSIEVTEQAHDAHNDRIDELMEDLIWTHELGADTYYRNQSGRIIVPSPFTAIEYWDMNQRPDESAFVLRAGAPAQPLQHASAHE
ncbi:NAD(P)/FAD-dependent oxidoreductase [Mycobacterium sp. DL440]|uniref:flavin-containing monooxygenase n=1 Tax=Mycobacterium sp. DL440 TaxID=2675523 RepID=UPI001AAE5E19|nr:NAD(P)/FAD-dependent oxidoreductase [Mycobacterium sp. DL440]